MKDIMELTDLVKEELCDAEKYAKLALEHKGIHPELSDMYYSLSLEELKHMSILHNAAVKLVNIASADDDPHVLGMMTVYDALHKREIEKERSVRVLHAMYRE